MESLLKMVVHVFIKIHPKIVEYDMALTRSRAAESLITLTFNSMQFRGPRIYTLRFKVYLIRGKLVTRELIIDAFSPQIVRDLIDPTL